MAITNGYTTLVALKAWASLEDSFSDSILEDAITSVSRWIDGYCNQRFWLDAAVADRDFTACDRYELKVDEIGTSTGVVVKFDVAGDGTFETTLAASDFQLLPVNAAQASPEAKPFTKIRMVGAQTLPIPYGTLARQERVRVTAKWGWPAEPQAVEQACLILAAETAKLKDAPFGVAGFGQFGDIRVRDNPKALNLLAPYRKHAVLVG